MGTHPGQQMPGIGHTAHDCIRWRCWSSLAPRARVWRYRRRGLACPPRWRRPSCVGGSLQSPAGSSHRVAPVPRRAPSHGANAHRQGPRPGAEVAALRGAQHASPMRLRARCTAWLPDDNRSPRGWRAILSNGPEALRLRAARARRRRPGPEFPPGPGGSGRTLRPLQRWHGRPHDAPGWRPQTAHAASPFHRHGGTAGPRPARQVRL